MNRMYSRRAKRAASTPLEDIVEEDDEYSGGISRNEEQPFVSGDFTMNDDSRNEGDDTAATRTEEGFVSGDITNGCNTGILNSEVIFSVKMPIQWVTVCRDLIESCITIYDPTQDSLNEADFEDRKTFFESLARILPQVLRYSGFYDARSDVVVSWAMEDHIFG